MATKGRWLSALITRALERGIRFVAPAQLYCEMKSEAGPVVVDST